MNAKKDLSVLFIVQAGMRFGIGHLARALYIARFYKNSFLLVLTDLKESMSLSSLIHDMPHQICYQHDKSICNSVLHDKVIDLIVVDCDKAANHLVCSVNALGKPTIVFDNVFFGSSAEVFIAPLPSCEVKSANFSELHHTPINRDYFLEVREISHVQNVLIALGGSDPNNNALKIISALKDQPYKITVIVGPLSQYKYLEEQENIEVVKDSKNIFPYIEQNDLIFCGPGLTMLEAMAAKKYVVAVAHTYKQYKDLKTLNGITVLNGSFFLTAQGIRNTIDKAIMSKFSLPSDFDFEAWWLELTDDIANRPASCPLCGSSDKKSLYRNSEQDRFICRSCGSIYLYQLKDQTGEVNMDTIIASSSEHDKKSYKEAVLNLREDSNRRIQLIKKLLPVLSYQYSYRLLDIGSEHGVFVQEAAHNGFSAQGIELSIFARRYSKDNYNIDILDSMDKIYETEPIYNVVTIWKKLEQLSEPLLYLKKIKELLPRGGVLVFRVPMVGKKRNFDGFFRITVKGGKKLAERAGFAVVYSIKSPVQSPQNEELIEFYCVKYGK